MKKIVLCLTALLLLLLPATNGWAESESSYQTIPFPGKRAKPENFFIAENGALMFKTEDAAYAYQDGQWVKSDMQPASDAFEITREGDAFTVLQDGEPIYTDREMQTLCIMDDAAAYGTKDNKVYQIDISTGKHTAICYVEGWESSDWAQQLLCSGRTLYVIQTLIPVIQTINLDLVAQQDTASLRIALASDMDIGNVVLASAEERFMEKHINTIIDMVKVTQDQLRLDLMSDPSSYDLIVCDPALWNDLAQAGIFADLESFPQLRDAWHLWIDMSSLCRYEGRLMGVPLWLNCDLLWVNDSLTGLLESVQWPEPDWTWDDFLQLARQCCQDLNDDGRPDLYIAYQRMFDTPYAHGLQAFSLPVHQAAILYQNGQVEDMQCTEILNMLSVWKTCYDEHLLYPADGYYEEPHMNMVVFAWNMPAEWCEYAETVDIRLTMPGLSETLRCNPADSVLLSISAYSAQMELAVDFAEFYMRFGADEHHYLKEHTYALTEILPYTKTWKIPSEFHDKHYVAALQNACRDTWELSLYNDMELHLARYLRGEISAEECARLWQEKLRMTQME